jgi:hypothetical protein
MLNQIQEEQVNANTNFTSQQLEEIKVENTVNNNPVTDITNRFKKLHVTLDAFCEKFKTPSAFRNYIDSEGLYVPKLSSVSASWLLKKAFQGQLPLKKGIIICPTHVNCTAEECVQIINKYLPNLEVSKRMEFAWLRNIAYTLESGNSIFALDRHRPRISNSQDLNYILKHRNIPIEIPEMLANVGEIESGGRKKNTIKKSVRQALGLYDVPRANTNTIQFDLTKDGIRKGCVVCLANSGVLRYTSCCSHPIHHVCYNNAVQVDNRCVMCRTANFQIQIEPSELTRAFEDPQ